MTAQAQPPGDPELVEFGKRLDASIASGMEALAKAQASQGQDPSRVWAALAPGWTVPLAEKCGFPGASRESSAAALGRLLEENVVDIFPVGDEPEARPEDGYYVMTTAARADTLRAYLAADEGGDPTADRLAGRQTRAATSPILKAIQSAAVWIRPEVARGAASLLATVAQIGTKILEAGTDLPVPKSLRDWAGLAALAGDSRAAAHAFDTRLKTAIEDQDVATIRDWIDVARPLAVLFEYAGDTDLSLALARAGRTIELTKRRNVDFRHLASFNRREEQVEAIRSLIDGPDDRWALHLIGPGGVGKTMTVRYATCLMTHAPKSPCADDPRPFARQVAVARVDFDYLNLDYPRINPGLLLVDLASELRAEGTAVTAKHFDRAEAEFRLLNDTQKAGGLRRERATLDARMAAGIRAYIDALHSIEKPAVLILDTCEELAKIEPGGPDTTLEETFRILRALHDGPAALADDASPPSGGVPSVRVILSGRRALAASGAGWRIPESALPVRPYLRIHEIRGFSHDETIRYLDHEHVRPDLVQPIVKASSPESRSSIGIDYDDPRDAPRGVPRCNPYQVRLYLDWARSEPPPTPEQVATAGSGRYVELRLIQRLHDTGLERVLPRLSVLGHFDQPTFLASTNLGPDEGDRLFNALADQEWIGMHRSGGDVPRVILDVSPNVRDMLTRYYAERRQPSPSELEPVARAVEHLTLEGDLASVDWADFDGGLRVFAGDPGRGATWWSLVERRLFAERSDWVPHLLDRVLSSDGAARAVAPDEPAGATENPLRPFVLATRARLLGQAREDVALATAWNDVVEATRSRRETPPFDRLHRRALAGVVAATRHHGTAPSADLVAGLWSALLAAEPAFADRQDAASALAAVETLVDYAELDPRSNLRLLGLPQPARGLARGTVAGANYQLDTGFRPSVNGWRFDNAFPPGPKVSFARIVSIADGAHDFAAAMTAAALDLWVSGVPAPQQTSQPARDDPGFLYLVKRQVQMVPPPLTLEVGGVSVPRRHEPSAFEDTWPSIRADLEAGRPVLLAVGVPAPQSGEADLARSERHHVLAYAAAETPGQIRILIYDPSRPADDEVELIVELEPDGEMTVDHPDLGGVPFVERVTYKPEDPEPWRGLATPPSEDVPARVTTSGPEWLAAEVERTHGSWMPEADDPSGAVAAIRALTRVQSGRAAIILGRFGEARQDLVESLDLIGDARPDASSLDWRPPSDVATRVRLEVARAAYPALLSATDTLALLGRPEVDTSTADGDRLVSTILDMQLAGALPEEAERLLDGWTDRATWQPLLMPNVAVKGLEPINAHRLVPPLFARVSELLAAFGQLAQARRYLQVAAAADAAGDLETRRSADRALLRLSRRLRSTDEGDASPASLAASPLPSDMALIRSLQGLGGRARPEERGDVPGPEAHATWQAGWAVDGATARTLVTWGTAALGSALEGDLPDPDLDRESLARDLRELTAVASEHHIEGATPGALVADPPARSWRTWFTRHPDRPDPALRLFLRDAALVPDGMSTGETTVPAELVERLGPRRCGEIAFEEGELLGLRLPGPAAAILRWAGSQYAASHDPFGVFATDTLGALLLTPKPGGHGAAPGPAGGVDAFAMQTTSALAAYELLAADLGRSPGTAPLPAAGELDAIAGAPTDATLGGLEPAELRPWITRLVACLAVRRAGGPSSAADDAFRAWLEGRYGPVGGGAAMPVEWAGYLARRTAEATLPAAGPDAAPAPGSSTSGTIALVLGITAAVGVGLFLAWRYVLSLAWPEVWTLGLLWQLGLFAATLAVFGIAIAIGRRYADSVAALTMGWSRLDVVIQPAGPDAGAAARGGRRSSPGPDRIAVSITPTLSILRPVARLPPLRLVPYRVYPPEVAEVSELDDYERLGAALPPGVRRLVERRVPLLRPPWHVQVMPRGDLQRVAWEALFTLASTKASDPPTQAVVRVTRMTDDGRTEVRAVPSGRLVGESVAGDAVATGVVRRALERGGAGGIAWTLAREVRSPGDVAAVQPQVVHVIGNTIEDHGGIALQPAPVRSYGSQVAPRQSTAPSPSSAEPASIAGRDQVVRAGDLKAAYPGALLFIVQGYPTEEATERVGSDRETANRSRLFAAELSRLGVAVIVIPPLEPAKATDVWGLVSRGAPAFLRHGPASILPSVTKAQGAAVASPMRKDAWERALDICVFDVPVRR